MNRSPHIQNSGMQVTWDADESAKVTRRELTGYQALASGNFGRARAFFKLSVAVEPTSAFRVTQACVRAGAYGLAVMVSRTLAEEVFVCADVGTPAQRLRIVIDCLTLPAVNLSTSQLLHMGTSEWSYLPRGPRVIGKLPSDKMELMDTAISYLQGSYEYSPVTTLKLCLILVSLGVLTEPRHRESVRASIRGGKNTEEAKSCNAEESKQIDELREKVLNRMSSEDLMISAGDEFKTSEDSHACSKEEEKVSLLEALTGPKRKKC